MLGRRLAESKSDQCCRRSVGKKREELKTPIRGAAACNLQSGGMRKKERKRMLSERLNEAAKRGRGSPSTLAGKALGLERAGS